MLITDDLARRLEHAEAVDAVGCVEAAWHFEPDANAAAKGIAGGFLIFCGAESPLTHAIGLGMHGPVTMKELAEVEHFFRSRRSPVTIDVCPHSDPTLRDILSHRGYRLTEWNNVMVRSLPAADLPPSPPGIDVRVARQTELELYVDTVIRGFFGRDEITDAESRLGRMLFHMPCSTVFLAEIEGEIGAVAAVSVRNRIANLFGDATLARWRGRGAHQALIAERLRMASGSGCELAMAGTLPGSISQRNFQRLGFQIAYSKITFVLDR